MTTTTTRLTIPDGASAEEWLLQPDGDYLRLLTWFSDDVGGIGVCVNGEQSHAGRVVAHISVYGDETTLSPFSARELAASLIEAAGRLERLQ